MGKKKFFYIMSIIFIILIFTFFLFKDHKNMTNQNQSSLETAASFSETSQGSTSLSSTIVMSSSSEIDYSKSSNSTYKASSSILQNNTSVENSESLDNSEKGTNFLVGHWEMDGSDGSIYIVYHENGKFESFSEAVGETLEGSYTIKNYDGKKIEIIRTYEDASIVEIFEIQNNQTLIRNVDGIAEKYTRK